MAKRTNQVSENLTAAALALSIMATASAQEYRLTDLVDLGFIPNPDTTGTLGINSNGEVVYGFDVGGDIHAFVWLPEPNYGLAAGFHDLSVQFRTQNPSIARDINFHGEVAGQVLGTRAGEGQAIVWDLATGMEQLLGFLEGGSWSRAIAIDDAPFATVVGESEVDGFCPDPPVPCTSRLEAVVVRSFRATLGAGPPTLIEFPPLETGDCDQTSLVRDAVLLAAGGRRAVGVSTTQILAALCEIPGQCSESLKDAASWEPDIPLTSFDPDFPSEGRGLNDTGQTVGWARRTSCRISARFWDTPATPIDLGGTAMPPMQAGEQSRAEAINDLPEPQVVGWNAERNLAVLWENAGGPPWVNWTAEDLNTVIPACSQVNNLTLNEAHDINDDGWIITWGTVGTGLTEQHAFLLTPVGDCAEDVNRDGVVNVLDLIALLLEFGLPCPVAEICWTDINNDCVTNNPDLIALLLAFGQTCPTNPAAASAGDGGGIESEPWMGELLEACGLDDWQALFLWLGEAAPDEVQSMVDTLVEILED